MVDVFIKGKDLKEFQDFLAENTAWVETIREALIVSARARQELKMKVLLYWKRISLKYNLDKDKVYNMNPETGLVNLFKNEEVKT